MSDAEDIAVTYDVSNDFFALWLDRGMNYTCGLFEPGDDLEAAQRRKLAWHRDAARIHAGSRVLDIGCGWGGALRFMAEDAGVRDSVGITLSAAQHAQAEALGVPGASFLEVDYRDYAPEVPFSAVISIGMFEHVATPEQARDRAHIEIYRKYFKRAWQWTQPGSWFSLQSVIQGRLPRDRAHLRELAWGTRAIFPGAITPRLEAVIASMNPWWEPVEVFTRREHYARTTAAWLRNLQAHEATIRETWGDAVYQDYERYLSACVMSFDNGYQSLAQLALRRVDGVVA